MLASRLFRFIRPLPDKRSFLVPNFGASEIAPVYATHRIIT